MGIRNRSHLSLLLVAVIALLAGCSTTSNVKKIDRLAAVDEEDPRVLVLVPDIKYYLLTTGGVPEPHADWTTAARQNFALALQEYAQERQVDITLLQDPDELTPDEVEYQKLYAAVGSTVLIHHFGMLPLPTKNKSFDWSLGPGIKTIGERHDADYALFSYYRDYQASGGRVAFALLAAAAGVGMSMGYEGGFASLVDLRTGDIVWFNQVVGGGGELRDPDGARITVESLFKDMPEN